MICLNKNDRGADLLIGYLEETLPPAERTELERHAESCAECRGLLEVQKELDEFPAPEVSPDFDARLYARIASEEQARAGAWWRKWLWRPAVPVAAAAAVAAVVLMIQGPGAESAPVDDEPKQAAVDPQIELLEQVLEDMELLMPLGSTPADVL